MISGLIGNKAAEAKCKKQDRVKYRTATQDRRDFWSLRYKIFHLRKERERLETEHVIVNLRESWQCTGIVKMHHTCPKNLIASACECSSHVKDAKRATWYPRGRQRNDNMGAGGPDSYWAEKQE